MPTSTNVTNLKINELTEAQYDTAVQGGVIGANELSIITDLDDAIQVSTMPTAAAGELGKVYQYIGTTDANYTHGYFYECVSDGGNPAIYSWSQTNVQPAPSGLPSQTGNSGKFLTTDGTDASWATVNALPDPTGYSSRYLTNDGSTIFWSNYIPLTNQANRNASLTDSVFVNPFGSTPSNLGNYSVGLGTSNDIQGDYAVGVGIGAIIGMWANCSIAIGNRSETGGSCSASIAIGYKAKISSLAQYAIQLGQGTNATSNTLSVGLSDSNNYRLLNSDGTIPAARLASTTGLADGNYRLRLTMSNGTPTLSWVAE